MAIKTDNESSGPLNVLLLVLGFAVFLLIVVKISCREPPLEPVAEVTGRVTIDSAPCVKANVLFSYRDKGIFIVAPTDEDGKFRVGIAKRYGLPYGTYQVTVVPPQSPDPRPDIPIKYRNPKTSGIPPLELGKEGAVVNIDMVSE